MRVMRAEQFSGYGGLKSSMNYLAVRLKAGERWSFQPPANHTVIWTAVGMGSVLVPDELQQGELAAFKTSSTAIDFEAQSDAEFVLGSAVPHSYSVKPRRGSRTRAYAHSRRVAPATINTCV